MDVGFHNPLMTKAHACLMLCANPVRQLSSEKKQKPVPIANMMSHISKRFLSSFRIRKVKLLWFYIAEAPASKTIMRYHFTPVRMAAIQKSTSNKC